MPCCAARRMDHSRKEARKCDKQLAKLIKRQAKAVEELQYAEARPFSKHSLPDAASQRYAK